MQDGPAKTCSTKYVHKDVVERVEKNMKPEDTLLRLAEFFKVFGDVTRLKILTAITGNELCVCDIACITGMSDSAISHQLRILRNTRLVKYRREGRVVFYSLDDEHISGIITEGISHVEE